MADRHRQAVDKPPDSSAATSGSQEEGDDDEAAAEAAAVAAEAYEREHVHGVYETIASHFSATRHRPWPLVSAFVRAQAPGALGLDVGCGNGKYLGDAAAGGSSAAVVLLGCDRSAALVALARAKGDAVAVADGLALPFRAGCADFVLCVAVVHHLSTRARRRAAVAELLACLRRRGRALVYVWALEQAGSRRGWDEGGEQDLLVPWVMKREAAKDVVPGAEAGGGGPEPDRVFQRYYHLYRKGELEEDVVAAGGEVLESGYERDNWWVIAGKPSPRA